MNKVYVVVEGQTEQTFVRDVLAPYMAHNGIFLFPALIGKPGHKGGDVQYRRAKKDIGMFLKQQGNTRITTMFDFSRIDPDWPGMKEVSLQIKSGARLSAVQKAAVLEKSTLKRIKESFPESDPENRFVPYIEMHEFEALLFSNPDVLSEKAGIDIGWIRNILDQYSNPEEINDDPEKTPGKRLQKLKENYRKVAMGKIICETIGIPIIREKCPHFDGWLSKLENCSTNSISAKSPRPRRFL